MLVSRPIASQVDAAATRIYTRVSSAPLPSGPPRPTPSQPGPPAKFVRRSQQNQAHFDVGRVCRGNWVKCLRFAVVIEEGPDHRADGPRPGVVAHFDLLAQAVRVEGTPTRHRPGPQQP